ncbi:DUF2505 domain-containing protein [Isoptericola sp. b441]|uniref:DUF2505 domain-containing protein n=1 Tax=Actinotalea lenta TaxID=3064654 RepID=A0ABT9DCC5_9CELL|nr:MULTISPECIES: DUF2505 domain-containing protein [unclassified Isoptericola]MDO8108532.1 DUF2505 domain-containing protein [Isoptericola sp. b441]MDO8119942.1 DUF2505 domain-containing protein [Isoptericola sp. b490]
MHVTAEARFGADPQTVAAMFADEGFVRAKVEASGALSHTAGVVGDPDSGFTVTTRRQMPTDSIPVQFRSLVGGTLEVRQVEAWEPAGSDGRHGTVVVEVTGAPVRLTGTMHLTGDAAGSTMAVAGELRASIPLFGAAVEKAMAEAVLAALTAEEGAARSWLARPDPAP